ncbi:hypothetical protein [Streptosporangium sp. NPDC020145]|uniref:hypothetical protein n=1 Tax=unclassified Streptosporangium TaxID=2632669 RepID=UPI0034289593
MSDSEVASKEALAAAPKIWRHTIQANPAAAVAFVNRAPAQQAGEAVFSNRSDGRVDVYYFL